MYATTSTGCHGQRQISTNSAVTSGWSPLLNLYVNAVYYPNWKLYDGHLPSSLYLGCISHIIYAFAWVNTDGSVYLSDEHADLAVEVDGSKGCLAACAALRRQRSRVPKILLAVGGPKGGMHFANAISTSQGRMRFAQTARDIVLRFDLDGLDIEWDCPATPREGLDYIELLALLRAYLPIPQFQLVAALPAQQWALQYIDLSRASSCLDYIFVMTFDFAGAWLDQCGHQSQLNSPWQPDSASAAVSVSSAVAYYTACRVPSRKIVVGVPLYGRSFLSTNGVGHPFAGNGGHGGTYDFKDLPRPGAEECIDLRLGAAYCYGADGEFVSYDNPETVRQKAKYVCEHALGGMFYWTGLGDASGTRSLVYNGYETMHRG